MHTNRNTADFSQWNPSCDVAILLRIILLEYLMHSLLEEKGEVNVMYGGGTKEPSSPHEILVYPSAYTV